MSKDKIRPGRITDAQVEAFDRAASATREAGKAGPGFIHAIRAGLAAAYVQREREIRESPTARQYMNREQRIRERVRDLLDEIVTPELSRPDLDPYPASVGEVADEIARYVMELDASGVARGLRELLVRRLLGDKGPAGGHLDPEAIKRATGGPAVTGRRVDRLPG